MECPKCKDPHCRYEESWYRKSDGKRKKIQDTGLKKKPHPRENFKAKCKKCGWEGEV